MGAPRCLSCAAPKRRKECHLSDEHVPFPRSRSLRKAACSPTVPRKDAGCSGQWLWRVRHTPRKRSQARVHRPTSTRWVPRRLFAPWKTAYSPSS